MKDRILHIVVDKACDDQILVICKGPFIKDTDYQIWRTDSIHFATKRTANKFVSDYAVTKLPFVLITDPNLPEDKQKYAAVYSEEGPITIERINAKL